VLAWVTREMDERYRKFAKERLAQHRTDFNQKATTASEPASALYLVSSTRLADLMMLGADETEKTICRLAQMARRRTGIHLIIATQRPSVDVVHGADQKPTSRRASRFRWTSSVDSAAVILDTTGAEGAARSCRYVVRRAGDRCAAALARLLRQRP